MICTVKLTKRSRPFLYYLVKTPGFLGMISQRYLMQVYLLTRNYYLMTNWDGKKRSFAGYYEGERTLYNIEKDCL